MKKLFLIFSVLSCMVVNVARAELTATSVISAGYPVANPRIAMTVDEENVAVMQPAVVYESGKDVEVVIFGQNFTVAKQFTLHDVVTEHKYDGTEDVSLSNLWIESADLQSVVVSRNFFAKNDKWCVLLCYSSGLHSDDAQSYKVIDEDGNILGELPGMKFGYEADIFLDQFYCGTPYLLVPVEYGYNGDDTFMLYTFTGTGQSGIEPTKVAALSSAYPNPLPLGQTFNVELSKPADDATFFSVIDMNGRQVLRRKIAAGESSYRLSGARFGRGHYVYTVIYKDGESVTGRLMAE
ncbi:MAG: T9SS type A sorting domain-containing protein [Muribaculaceae bacterium]|nr:T9SS type A sorting domain-containing protein [Muribaculaceae bacterium]